jgi:predicted dehydrogenase
MTIDVEKMSAIFDAIERTGKALRVTFNYRYSPTYTKYRQLLMQGVIGRPLAVDFAWLLDTSHGADYFRRWHREKQNSGGLLVHKATHH